MQIPDPFSAGALPSAQMHLPPWSIDGLPHTGPLLHVISARWGRQKVLNGPAGNAICLGALYDTGVEGCTALQKVL